VGGGGVIKYDTVINFLFIFYYYGIGKKSTFFFLRFVVRLLELHNNFRRTYERLLTIFINSLIFSIC
jgi:hypothetical protein